jgi:hypothetical protein
MIKISAADRKLKKVVSETITDNRQISYIVANAYRLAGYRVSSEDSAGAGQEEGPPVDTDDPQKK